MIEEDQQEYPVQKYVILIHWRCSGLWTHRKWFFDDEKQLVVIQDDGHESRYILHTTDRLPRKMINNVKSDWWGFNNKRIILNEELFDWKNVGLNEKLQAKRSEALKDKKEAQSTNNPFVTFSILELLRGISGAINRRQNALERAVCHHSYQKSHF